MSLINEALKRAKQVQVRQPAVAVAEPVLQPVVARSEPSPLMAWAIPALVALMLLLAVSCLWLWWRQSHSVRVARIVNQLKPTPPPTAAVQPKVPEPVRPAEAEPVATVVTLPATSNLVSATSVTAQAPASNATQVPLALAPDQSTRKTNDLLQTGLLDVAPASFHLQGIFYRASRASALINGQTLFVGDEVEGAKLLAIDRQSVRLLVDGRRTVLKLH